VQTSVAIALAPASDFMGDRADEVITLAPGVMRVWGSRGANGAGTRVRRSRDYLREQVVNHAHY
jgi:hypothetical protein